MKKLTLLELIALKEYYDGIFVYESGCLSETQQDAAEKSQAIRIKIDKIYNDIINH